MKNIFIFLSIFLSSSLYASCYLKANHNDIIMKNCTNKTIKFSFLNFFSGSKQEKSNLKPILNIKNIHPIHMKIENSSAEGINWYNIDVPNSNIKTSTFYSPHFIKVRFNKLMISDVKFEKPTFKSSSFNDTTFNQGSFIKSKIHESTFRNVTINQSDFHDSSIINSNINGNLEQVNFQKSNWVNTSIMGLISGGDYSNSHYKNFKINTGMYNQINFSSSFINKMRTEGATFNQANFSGSKISNLSILSSNLYGNNFGNSEIKDLNISNSHLINGNFDNTTFEGTINFKGSELCKINLLRANIKNLNAFNYALKSVKSACQVTLPNGKLVNVNCQPSNPCYK